MIKHLVEQEEKSFQLLLNVKIYHQEQEVLWFKKLNVLPQKLFYTKTGVFLIKQIPDGSNIYINCINKAGRGHKGAEPQTTTCTGCLVKGQNDELNPTQKSWNQNYKPWSFVTIKQTGSEKVQRFKMFKRSFKTDWG